MGIGIGLNAFYSGGGSSGLSTFTYDAVSESVFSAQTSVGSTPNTGRKYTIDRMVKRLKDKGIFSKITGLWVAGNTAASSLINIVNPGVNNLVSNGSPTFTPNVGWTFTVIADFLDTGIVANTTSANDFSMGYFGGPASTSSNDMGAQATGVAIYMKNNTMAAALNGANQSPAGGSSLDWDSVGGFRGLSRTSSTGFNCYHHGVAVPVATDTSTAPTSTLTFTVGKVNGQSVVCKRTIHGAFIGKGLTNSEMEQLHAIVQNAIDSIQYGDLDIRDAGFAPADVPKYDLVIYGATLAAITAAKRAKQLGMNVCVVGGWRERNIGGMTANGLGFVDYDVSNAIGGLAYDVVAGARTLDGSALTRTATVGNGPVDLACQPRNVKNTLHSWMDDRTNLWQIPLYWSNGCATATRVGTQITSFTTVDGRTFTADYFLDTSEELDLTFCAGISTTYGREAAGSGSETLNGWRANNRSTGSNDVQIENNVSARMSGDQAYNVVADTGSGLIYGINTKPSKTLGQADISVMSYTFRQTWNNNRARRVPFSNTPPPGYSAAKYELMGRYLAFYPAATINSIMKPSTLANTATDTNNTGGISFNLLGSGTAYAACELAGTRAQVYAAREVIQKDVESWVRGLIYWLLYSGDSRIPSSIVTALSAYGWETRHYLDPHPNDDIYWPQRIYVREHRRLVGDYIADATDATKTDGTSPRSTKTVSTVSYRFDSHPHERWVNSADNTIFCEGSINLSQAALGGSANGADGITPIPYEAYLPKTTECGNLAVTFGLSCTHIFITAARMELTTAQAGESLAYAIKQAFDNGKQALQSVDYSTLRTSILAAPTSFAPTLPQLN